MESQWLRHLNSSSWGILCRIHQSPMGHPGVWASSFLRWILLEGRWLEEKPSLFKKHFFSSIRWPMDVIGARIGRWTRWALHLNDYARRGGGTGPPSSPFRKTTPVPSSLTKYWSLEGSTRVIIGPRVIMQQEKLLAQKHPVIMWPFIFLSSRITLVNNPFYRLLMEPSSWYRECYWDP